MTIKVHSNKIEFVSGNTTYTILETEAGFAFNGAITGNVADYFQGENHAFFAGGRVGNPSPNPAFSLQSINTIERFPFATDASSRDFSDLTRVTATTAGQFSETHGYVSGGAIVPGAIIGGPPAGVNSNVIDKFPFATTANATDVGDVTQARHDSGGHSSSSHGYTSGGDTAGYGNPSTPTSVVFTIDRFPFAEDSNATDVGDLASNAAGHASMTSSTHGYAAGGFWEVQPAPRINVIQKFTLASTVTSSDVGDLSEAKLGVAGISSRTTGYAFGGLILSPPPPDGTNINTIEKFPFATDSNSTDLGDLTSAMSYSVGHSSVNSGYNTGSNPNSGTTKFPFSSETTRVSVGTILSENKTKPANPQD